MLDFLLFMTILTVYLGGAAGAGQAAQEMKSLSRWHHVFCALLWPAFIAAIWAYERMQGVEEAGSSDE